MRSYHLQNYVSSLPYTFIIAVNFCLIVFVRISSVMLSSLGNKISNLILLLILEGRCLKFLQWACYFLEIFDIYTFYEIEEMIFHSIQDRWLVAWVWITIKDYFIWQLHSITMKLLHCELHKGCDYHCIPDVWHSFGDLVRHLMLYEWMIPNKCFLSELIEVSKLFFKVNQNLAYFRYSSYIALSSW